MKCNHSYTPAAFQTFDRLRYNIFQNIQFIIHFNTDCLKRTFCRMRTILPRSLGNCLFDHIHKFKGSFNRLFRPFLNDKLSYSFTPAFFTITVNNIRQFFFFVTVNYIISIFFTFFIHPHIQRTIMHIRKSTLRCVQLIRRYTKIKKNSVNLINIQAI